MSRLFMVRDVNEAEEGTIDSLHVCKGKEVEAWHREVISTNELNLCIFHSGFRRKSEIFWLTYSLNNLMKT